MKRLEFTKATMRSALERAGIKCEATGPRYGLEEGKRCNADLAKGVNFDHAVPAALGGDNSLENCMAVCIACHRFKTANDVAQIAKAKRQRDYDTGVKVAKQKIKSAGFPKHEKPQRIEKQALPPRRIYEERT